MYKRILLILAFIMAAGFIVGTAWACQWNGSGWGSGSGYYHHQGGRHQNFMNDTASIREELAAKHDEYNALMAQQNPDPDRAAQLQEDIARLNNQMQQTARQYDMPTRGGNHSASSNYHGYDGHRSCW